MADSADKKEPSVKLSFGQLVGLALFILGLIGGSVKLLYDAIDKRLDKIEDKIDKHDERIDGIDQKVSMQEVKIEHLQQMRALQKERDALIAAAGDDDDDEGEGAEGADEFTPSSRRRTRRRRSRGMSESWTPRSDLHQQDCRQDSDCPRHHACHSGKCWPPGGGGGPPGADEGGPPPEPDEPPPETTFGEPQRYEDTFDGATKMVVETDTGAGETRRERRKRERCEQRWRRGCPPPPVRLAGDLRHASDELALMQLREASDRLAKLQRRERRA